MNLIGFVLIIFVVVMSLKIYQESDAFNLKCIVSNVDGNTYCVRERAKLQLAADLLAKVTGKLKKLTTIESAISKNRLKYKNAIEILSLSLQALPAR